LTQGAGKEPGAKGIGKVPRKGHLPEITLTDNQIRSFFKFGNKKGDFLRVMLTIRIKSDHGVVSLLQYIPESVQKSGAFPLIGGLNQNLCA
jgi:hypothetical protein